MAATLKIGGVAYTMIEDQHDLTNALGERQRFKCDIIDYTGTAHFTKGQSVTITDPVLGLFYTGVLNSDKEVPVYPTGAIIHTIDCIDFGQYIAGKRTFTGVYPTPAKAAKIAIDQVSSVLGPEGIAQNYANRFETTATDFSQGILTNTVGTLSVGDGDLELAPSGTSLTYTENTTAQFGSGALANLIAANNTLAPATTPAIKFVATLNSGQVGNTITSMKIWSGSVVVTAIPHETFILYDIFIDPSSPQATASVNCFFSDGTNLAATGTYLNAAADAQHILPAASNDLTGLATIGWYPHGVAIGAAYSGKTLVGVSFDIAGTQPGTYKAYIRNVIIEDQTGTIQATIFNGTLNDIQQLQNYGYTNISLSVVQTYNIYNYPIQTSYGASCSRTTSSISIDAVKLLRSSYITWQVVQPALTQLVVRYSLDGTAFTACTNNAPLPNLPAGLDLTGKSIYLQYEFYALQGANPELSPILKSLTLTLNTSYAATKTDVSYSTLLQADWNAGTLTNLVANSSNELTLNGLVRNWDDGNDSGQGIFTSYATLGVIQNTASNRTFLIWNIPANCETTNKGTFAGTWQNFTTETDVQINATTLQNGLSYRQTNFGNSANSFAYVINISDTTFELGRGSNSTGSGSYTILGTLSVTSQVGSWHRIKATVNGNNHKIYLDDVLLINVNDSTYTSAGYISYHCYNPTTNGNQQAVFDNFGVVTALSGTWISPATSLSTVSTYGTSIISWRDKSPTYFGGSNTTILVEASYDAGSTYQATPCTNGSPLPGLVAGQSMSGKTLKIRVTLSSTTAASLAALDSLIVRVLGTYSTTGTRSTVPSGNDMVISRTVPSGFGIAFDGQTWTQTGTGTTSVGSGELQIAGTTGDVHMRLGTRTGTDMDETDRVSISVAGMNAGMTLRYQDANNHYRLAITTTGITIVKVSSGTTTILSSIAATYATNIFYRMRFRVVGSGPATLSGRTWLDGTLEPTTWTITASD